MLAVNKARADRIGGLLLSHATYDDEESAIVDALVDLMHLADLTSIEFPNALRVATMHYDAEVNGE